jgi:hypothetical protein
LVSIVLPAASAAEDDFPPPMTAMSPAIGPDSVDLSVPMQSPPPESSPPKDETAENFAAHSGLEALHEVEKTNAILDSTRSYLLRSLHQ